MADSKRPGFMVYFETVHALQELSVEERGRMYVAMAEYAEFGVVPDLDGLGKVVWSFIQPKIDRDSDAYEARKADNKYAAYCRDCKQKGREPATREAWDGASEEMKRNLLALATSKASGR